jgi:hypothetical protein
MSKRNARQGNQTQRYVDEVNQWLATQGRLFMFRVSEEIKVTRSSADGVQGFKAGHTYLDFAGLLAPAGRFTGMEVKTVSDDPGVPNFPFSRLRKTQAKSAMMTVSSGGIVVVYIRRLPNAAKPGSISKALDYIVPYDSDGNLAGITNRKSLPWCDAELFAIRYNETWLDALERIRQKTGRQFNLGGAVWDW